MCTHTHTHTQIGFFALYSTYAVAVWVCMSHTHTETHAYTGTRMQASVSKSCVRVCVFVCVCVCFQVNLLNYPCVVRHAPALRYGGHSSHVMNVRWSKDEKYAISVGGRDRYRAHTHTHTHAHEAPCTRNAKHHRRSVLGNWYRTCQNSPKRLREPSVDVCVYVYVCHVHTGVCSSGVW